jgi:hypothetical protein
MSVGAPLAGLIRFTRVAGPTSHGGGLQLVLPLRPSCSRPSTRLTAVTGLVKRQAACEVRQLFAKDEPPAMQAGLERLIFDP